MEGIRPLYEPESYRPPVVYVDKADRESVLRRAAEANGVQVFTQPTEEDGMLRYTIVGEDESGGLHNFWADADVLPK